MACKVPNHSNVCACCLCPQAGAKVDAQDKALRTPLLEAIVNDHVEVARYLVQSGASVYHTVSPLTHTHLGDHYLSSKANSR